MPVEAEKKSRVETISLAAEMDRRVALASVRIDEVLIRGVAVWRNQNGSLRVKFPHYWLGSYHEEAISLPEELRAEVEADVISAYKDAKTNSKNSNR